MTRSDCKTDGASTRDARSRQAQYRSPNHRQERHQLHPQATVGSIRPRIDANVQRSTSSRRRNRQPGSIRALTSFPKTPRTGPHSSRLQSWARFPNASRQLCERTARKRSPQPIRKALHNRRKSADSTAAPDLLFSAPPLTMTATPAIDSTPAEQAPLHIHTASTCFYIDYAKTAPRTPHGEVECLSTSIRNGCIA